MHEQRKVNRNIIDNILKMSSDSFKCNELSYSLALRNYFSYSTGEDLVMEIVGPIALILAIINIVFFAKIKILKQPPADILLFISVFSIVKILTVFATIIYDAINPPLPPGNPQVPPSFDTFCTVTGFFDVMSELAKFIYNFVFCFYYISKIRNPLKAWVSQNKEIHVLCFILIAMSSGILYFTNSIGISIFGVCSFKFIINSTYVYVALAFGYIGILTFSSYFFLKYLKKVSREETSTKKFFRYYFKYLVIVSIVFLIQGVSNLIVAITCSSGSDSHVFTIFRTISTLVSVCIPICITFIMISHPGMKKLLLVNILQTLRKICKQKSNQIKRQSFYDDLLTTNRQSILIELNQWNTQDQVAFLIKLKQKNRACLLSTILGCITLEQAEYSNRLFSQKNKSIRSSIVEEDNEELFSWNYNQKIEITITENITNFFAERIFPNKLPTVAIKFISYCPTIFKQFMAFDSVTSVDSLNPMKNLDQILKNVQSDGGRSGQFFYFNHDSTLILKTMSSVEKSVLLERIEHFHKYFEVHPESFIVRIYGVYTIINSETNEQIHFMLMGNILKKINKKYVLRVYDMKGSTHHRKVIQDMDSNEEEIKSHKTLKDKDFQKLEEKVWINQEDSKKVISFIQDDSNFFLENNLIDYSLILMKVNFNALALDENADKILENMRVYKSTKQSGVIYVFGIIDYLETWNIKKKSQKWYKSLFTKSDQISAQNPSFYSERFMKNLINTIFSS